MNHNFDEHFGEIMLDIKHYCYKVDHDLGFAPNPDRGLCTLSGCKKLIEKYARRGSWVIGIGGKNTNKLHKIIYLMKVGEQMPFAKFKSDYLSEVQVRYSQHHGEYVLISRDFCYFGDQALSLPPNLTHLARRIKCVKDEEIQQLLEYFGNQNVPKGKIGNPNNWRCPFCREDRNLSSEPQCRKCNRVRKIASNNARHC